MPDGREARVARHWVRRVSLVACLFLLPWCGLVWYHWATVTRYGPIGLIPSRLLLRYDSSWFGGLAAQGVLLMRAESEMLDTHCRLWYCRKYTSVEEILRGLSFYKLKDGSMGVELFSNTPSLIVDHRVRLWDCRDTLIAALDVWDALDGENDSRKSGRGIGEVEQSSFPLLLEYVSLRRDGDTLQPCIMGHPVGWSDVRVRSSADEVYHRQGVDSWDKLHAVGDLAVEESSASR